MKRYRRVFRRVSPSLRHSSTFLLRDGWPFFVRGPSQSFVLAPIVPLCVFVIDHVTSSFGIIRLLLICAEKALVEDRPSGPGSNNITCTGPRGRIPRWLLRVSSSHGIYRSKIYRARASPNIRMRLRWRERIRRLKMLPKQRAK